MREKSCKNEILILPFPENWTPHNMVKREKRKPGVIKFSDCNSGCASIRMMPFPSNRNAIGKREDTLWRVLKNQ